MAKDDLSYKGICPEWGGGGQEIEVNPNILYMYLSGDPKTSDCMMREIFTYHAKCAEAKREMYSNLIACIDNKKKEH